MHPKIYLTTFVPALALFVAAVPLQAAKPIDLQHTSLQSLEQQFQVDWPGLKKTSAVPTDSLKFIQQRTDKNQVSHLRMQQQYEGFEVFGGYAILHRKQTANKKLKTLATQVKMNGTVYGALKNELGKPADDFIKQGQTALKHFKAQYSSKALSDGQVIPLVYVDQQNQAHWAYKVSVFIRYTDQIPARPTAIIDAKTYQPFIKWNDVKTNHTIVKGKGAGGNSKIGEYSYGTGIYPFLELTRNNKTQTCFMENPDVKVIDMNHRYGAVSKAMQFTCLQGKDKTNNVFNTGYHADGYDRENGAFSPTNDALYVGYVIKHMYQDWYDVQVLSNQDGSPMQLVMRVHYGEGYENAYWDNKQMTFGDGEMMLYPLVSIGIGSHEVSHGFTEQHANLAYYGQSGGMNEAFSDMAAQAAEYYATGQNSWQIAAELMKENSGYEALRYMDKPRRDGRSIESADQYRKGLDVHYSSGVYNRLYYLLANQPGWDVRKAFEVMIKANMDYWTPYSTFDEGGCGIINAARDLDFSVEDIKKSLRQVAINYQFCEG